MLLKHILPGVACIALLAGCVTEPRVSAGAGVYRASASVTVALAEADAAISAGQSDKGVTILKTASANFPTDKLPLVRLAQLRFDQRDYGDAIVHALSALERDPDDMQAHSIAAVGGLRVAIKALSDLTQKNNLNGSVRTEAQELAKLLRARLGDELVPRNQVARVARPAGPAKAASATPAAGPAPAASKGADDPFAGLGK